MTVDCGLARGGSVSYEGTVTSLWQDQIDGSSGFGEAGTRVQAEGVFAPLRLGLGV